MGKHSRIKRGRRATNPTFGFRQDDSLPEHPDKLLVRIRNWALAILFGAVFCGMGLIFFIHATILNGISNLSLHRLPTAEVQVQQLEVGWRKIQKGQTVPDVKVKFTFQLSGQSIVSTNFYPESRPGMSFEDCLETRDGLASGEKSFCWYDPRQPQKAFLDIPSSFELDAFAGIFFGMIFMCLGILAFMFLIGFDQTSWALRIVAVTGFGGIGAFFFCMLLISPTWNYYRSTQWQSMPGTVVNSGWRQIGKSSKPEIIYQYTVNNRSYLSKRMDFYGTAWWKKGLPTEGSQLNCLVNPSKPWQSVVDRSLNWMSLMGIGAGVITVVIFRIPLRRKL